MFLLFYFVSFLISEFFAFRVKKNDKKNIKNECLAYLGEHPKKIIIVTVWTAIGSTGTIPKQIH